MLDLWPFVYGIHGIGVSGTIMASYAGGAVDGGDGGVSVGGLVGFNEGTITASYATGDVDGGDGIRDTVGGLVGMTNNGTITDSYAAGDVDGGDDRGDSVGRLVGRNSGTITASYATGAVDGGAGGDRVGGLVGLNDFGGMITTSYGFGTQMGGETAGVDRSDDASPAGAVGNAVALTAANSSTEMGNRWSARVWDFAAGMNPGLKWITGFDSTKTTPSERYPCDMALLPTLPTQQMCGGIIPGQDRTP